MKILLYPVWMLNVYLEDVITAQTFAVIRITFPCSNMFSIISYHSKLNNKDCHSDRDRKIQLYDN